MLPVTPNVHGERRARRLRASVSTVRLGDSLPRAYDDAQGFGLEFLGQVYGDSDAFLLLENLGRLGRKARERNFCNMLVGLRKIRLMQIADAERSALAWIEML
jgi:hypothetical protein